MKIRTGFVSNSSSSSFCIFGIRLEASDEDFFNPPTEESEDGYVDDSEYWEKLQAKAEKLGLEFHHDYECESVYVGRAYSSIKDKETGKEFRDSTKEKVQKFLGKKMKCESIEETISC